MNKEKMILQIFNKKNVRCFFGRIALCLILAVCISLSVKTPVKASGALDYIRNYEITVAVEDDASLYLIYHIDWEVLDSDSEGPLEWVSIGLPNKHYIDVEALSSNITHTKTVSSSQSQVNVYFDRAYYEGEVVSFDFVVHQDYMYEIDKSRNDYTDYSFTPGWFDGIKVENLTIKWPADKVDTWMPSCEMEGDYLVWRKSLDEGERFTVEVSYPNDAYDFNITKSNEVSGGDYSGSDSSWDGDDIGETLLGLIYMFLCLPLGFGPAIIPIVLVAIFRNRYRAKANFGTGDTKKVTRTLVTYYPTCRGCGATRKPNEQNCSYCGRSFIEKEETITEEKCPEDKKDILKFTSAGEFKYSSHPNTFVRVNVVNIPRPRTTTSSRSSIWGGGSSGSSHSSSSSHHSSCAHSHCACACACACAGGGRAGCSQKDFYKTNLKLKQL